MKRFFPASARDASRPRTLAAPTPCDSKAGMLFRRLLLALVLAAAVAAGNFLLAGDGLAWRVGAPFALALVVALLPSRRAAPPAREPASPPPPPAQPARAAPGTRTSSRRPRWRSLRSRDPRLPCCAVTDRGFTARGRRARPRRRRAPAAGAGGSHSSRTFVTPRKTKRRKPIACLISACRRKTCRTRAGRIAQRGGGGAVAAPMRRRGRRPIEAPGSAAPNRSGDGAPASPPRRLGSRS